MLKVGLLFSACGDAQSRRLLRPSLAELLGTLRDFFTQSRESVKELFLGARSVNELFDGNTWAIKMLNLKK